MIYLQKPEKFDSRFEVVGCFLEYDGKFLLLHRQDSKPQGSTWGLPGGKVEKGETALEAMVRELEEETGYKTSPNELIFSNTIFVRYPDYDFIYHMYRLPLTAWHETRIDPEAHKDFLWVTPNEALQKDLILDFDACIKLEYNL